jgi:hypothetical protein
LLQNLPLYFQPVAESIFKPPFDNVVSQQDRQNGGGYNNGND